jgi:phosphonate transport system substrate-binding protein
MKSFLLFISILFFVGCDKKVEDYEPQYSDNQTISKKVLIFGVHPLHNPKRLFEVYQPLVDYLNSHLDGITIKLEASRNYASYNKKLFSRHFDFSLPNPYQTVQSLKHRYRVFGKMGDDESFRGIILVRKDSGIKTVYDLKGKSVSYPAPTALAATIMPQWFLYTHGINVTKDIKNSYVGSQESSIMNVYLGKSAASSTWPLAWDIFIQERPEILEKVKIMWETKSLPNNGLVVKEELNKELVEKISNLLFTLQTHDQGRELLKAINISKFEKANTQTYDVVVQFLEKFENEVREIRLKDDK